MLATAGKGANDIGGTLYRTKIRRVHQDVFAIWGELLGVGVIRDWARSDRGRYS